MDLVGLQLADGAFRAAHSNLRLGDYLRADFQLRRNVLKYYGCADGHLCRLLVW